MKLPKKHLFSCEIQRNKTPKQGCFLTKSSGHGGVHDGLTVAGWKIKPSKVSAFVVVVFYIQASQLGEFDPQSTAGIVNILAIQSLESKRERGTDHDSVLTLKQNKACLSHCS